MKKIICVICEMPRDEFWLPLSIKSYISWVDKIIIVDGTKYQESDRPIENEVINSYLDKYGTFGKYHDKIHVINSPYPHNDKGADGIQRGKYLKFIQDNYPDDLAIVVDSDEVLADDAEQQVDEMIELLEKNPEADIINPRMEHFIDDFYHVDAAHLMHFCPGRVFRIKSDLQYPESEHPVITSKGRRLSIHQPNNLSAPVFYYHYAYVKGKEDIIIKFKKHRIKSEIHSKDQLIQWKNSHLFGVYPKKTFLGLHPKPIREEFELR